MALSKVRYERSFHNGVKKIRMILTMVSSYVATRTLTGSERNSFGKLSSLRLKEITPSWFDRKAYCMNWPGIEPSFLGE